MEKYDELEQMALGTRKLNVCLIIAKFHKADLTHDPRSSKKIDFLEYFST